MLDHAALLARVLRAVDGHAYKVPTTSVPQTQRDALAAVGAAIGDASVDPEDVRAMIEGLHAEGVIDRVHRLSALGVLAASPRVADHVEALRLAGEQELAAYETFEGPALDVALASVERHRGVAFFLAGAQRAALDHFLQALEHQRTPENLGNVLAAVLRSGDLAQAEELLTVVRRSSPAAFVLAIDDAIDTDPDLSALRSPEAS